MGRRPCGAVRRRTAGVSSVRPSAASESRTTPVCVSTSGARAHRVPDCAISRSTARAGTRVRNILRGSAHVGPECPSLTAVPVGSRNDGVGHPVDRRARERRFAPWGWGSTRFGWTAHTVIINNAPWARTWANRATYVHPYGVPRYTAPRPVEEHRLIERSPRERDAQRAGRGTKEDHQKEAHRR